MIGRYDGQVVEAYLPYETCNTLYLFDLFTDECVDCVLKRDLSEKWIPMNEMEVLAWANYRKIFSTASRVDKVKRSAPCKMGQHRLWIDGWKIQGPVKLLHIYKRWKMGVDDALSERVWFCELMFRDEVRAIGEYDLGAEINAMEVMAWAAK